MAQEHGPARWQAVTEATRSELRMVEVVVIFCLVTAVIFAVSLTRRDASMQMQVAGLGLTVMYFLCVWHAVKVPGVLKFFGTEGNRHC